MEFYVALVDEPKTFTGHARKHSSVSPDHEYGAAARDRIVLERRNHFRAMPFGARSTESLGPCRPAG
jgi:hypothetical protein